MPLRPDSYRLNLINDCVAQRERWPRQFPFITRVPRWSSPKTSNPHQWLTMVMRVYHLVSSTTALKFLAVVGILMVHDKCQGPCGSPKLGRLASTCNVTEENDGN